MASGRTVSRAQHCWLRRRVGGGGRGHRGHGGASDPVAQRSAAASCTFVDDFPCDLKRHALLRHTHTHTHTHISYAVSTMGHSGAGGHPPTSAIDGVAGGTCTTPCGASARAALDAAMPRRRRGCSWPPAYLRLDCHRRRSQALVVRSRHDALRPAAQPAQASPPRFPVTLRFARRPGPARQRCACYCSRQRSQVTVAT